MQIQLHLKSKLSLAFLLLIYFLHYQAYEFLNDDAYISFRFSWNWAHHGEIVYNLGERVEGYTNFLWVAMGALVLKLGGDLPLWANRLSLMLGCITLLALWFFDERLGKKGNLNRQYQLLTLSLLVLSPAYACWSSGGLETQLFSCCFTWSWLYLLKGLSFSPMSQLMISQSQDQQIAQDQQLIEDSRLRQSSQQNVDARQISFSLKNKSLMLSGLLMALAAMSRPEGMLLFGITAIYLSLKWIYDRQNPWAYLTSFTLLFAPFYAWKWHYYGYPFPNTYYVKVGAEGAWKPGLLYFGDWLLVHPWLLIPLFYFLLLGIKGLYAVSQSNRSKWSYLFHPQHLLWSYALVICAHVIRVGGDFMALHRFFVPILPLLAYLFAPWLSQALKLNTWKRLDELGWKNQKKQMLILSLLLVLLTTNAWYQHHQALKVGSTRGVDSIGWLKQFSEQCSEIGKWIDQNAPVDTRLATTAAGALPYYAKRYTVDLLGLNDAWIAHHVPAHGTRPGHTKSAPFRYPIDKQVNYLIYHPNIMSAPTRAPEQYMRALKPFGFEWKNIKVPQMQPQWWGVFYRPPLSSPSLAPKK
jgi:arabinofuranosyltransferase